jgi:cell shape-determining protein MreC
VYPRAPSIRSLLIAAIALAATAFAPLRWLWWVGDVAAIVALPLSPLTDGGNALAAWLRPGVRWATRGGAPGSDLEERWGADAATLERLTEDRDTYRALWHAERLRNEDLLQRLADVRLAEEFHRGSVFEPLRADIVGRSPAGLRGPVRLNAGRAAEVSPGDVAVFRGAHLVGRVVGEVEGLTSMLLWVADPATGKLSAAIPREPEPSAPDPGAIRVLLVPEGDGTFTADVAEDAGARLGDHVVMDDPTWPDTARGMIVGSVESVERRDDQPLRVRLRIRPAFDLHELRSVTLKIQPGREQRPAEGGGDPGSLDRGERR